MSHARHSSSSSSQSADLAIQPELRHTTSHPENTHEKNAKNKQKDGTRAAFAGPGSSVSKPGGVRPHRSKLLNRLDPRFNAHILEQKRNGDLEREPEEIQHPLVE